MFCLFSCVCFIFGAGAPAAVGLGGVPGGDEWSRGAGAGWIRESPVEGAHRHFRALH